MKSLTSRLAIAAVLAVTAWLSLVGTTGPKAPVLQPDKLIILSTTDVKGKTGPCG
ncbi:MAG: hypothetical protein HYR73_02875 [Candidatus Eisenbacteria bacterium]|nr:hypothetical protein [Candidatus Eisenbacteria bacterium]